MRLALPLMLGVLALGTKAGAQAVPPPDAGLDGHGFSPAPVDGDVRDPLVVNRIGGWSPRQAFVSGLFEYAESPLLWCARRYHDSTCLVQERLLDDVYALNLNGGYALNSRLRLYSTVPLFMASESDHRPNGGGFGDIRLGAQAAMFKEGPLQVGFMPWVDLPTGNETFFLGDTGVSGAQPSPARSSSTPSPCPLISAWSWRPKTPSSPKAPTSSSWASPPATCSPTTGGSPSRPA